MHMYKRGLQVCAYHFLNFHLVSTSCLPTLVVVGVQKHYTPNGCLISCSEASVAASDSRPSLVLSTPHRKQLLKNLLIYPVNASKKTHNHLYFPYWNSNSQMIRLVLERLKSVNMSEQTLVIAHCLLLQFHSVCQSTLFISRCPFCELLS